jgi:NAD-dependent SIR2 family protein deacetylase
MKTAIFLGAGASAAEGAPMQKDLFKNYFQSVSKIKVRKRNPNSAQRMKHELGEFFRLIFGINVASADLNEIEFPTFEEALGVLDLAEIRRESLMKFYLEDVGSYGNRIRLVRQFMIMAMAKAIDDSLRRVKGIHVGLIANLKQQRLLNRTIFVTTNYDILIDNALLGSQLEEIPGKNIDYSVDFTNFDLPANYAVRWRLWRRPTRAATKLFKLHGSLNWLYCSTCNALSLTPGMKGVVRLIQQTHQNIARCGTCRTFMSPIIVPPTFYKDMSRVFLSLVWNKAENELRQVEHLIFCGYSFPDADIHVKYLLKRVQTNRPNDKPLRFTVINNHEGKTPEQSEDEKARFARFLGRVKYTEASFDQFAEDPRSFYL